MSIQPGTYQPTQGDLDDAVRGKITWEPLFNKPKESCRKCHGRGYIGRLPDSSYVPCTCIRKESNS